MSLEMTNEAMMRLRVRREERGYDLMAIAVNFGHLEDLQGLVDKHGIHPEDEYLLLDYARGRNEILTYLKSKIQ